MEQKIRVAGTTGSRTVPRFVTLSEIVGSFGQHLRVMAAERGDDDVRIEFRECGLHLRRPVAVVGSSEPSLGLVALARC